MLEIIAIILLSKKNGALAESKGLKSSTWVWYTVLTWIGLEFAGGLIGVLIFGQDNLAPAYLLAIISAILGYFIIRDVLKRKPDNTMNDDINKIGVTDLYPDKDKN